MVNGTIDELKQYLPDCIRDLIMDYIKSINEDTAEGYTSIIDDKVYGRVISYNTKPKQECKIEAHNRYIDIQISIKGTEGIEVYQRKDLDQVQKYDSETDVAFYKYDKRGHFASIKNIPGRFTMLFSADAHQPQINVNETDGLVKKFVVKIDKTLFEGF